MQFFCKSQNLVSEKLHWRSFLNLEKMYFLTIWNILGNKNGGLPKLFAFKLNLAAILKRDGCHSNVSLEIVLYCFVNWRRWFTKINRFVSFKSYISRKKTYVAPCLTFLKKTVGNLLKSFSVFLLDFLTHYNYMTTFLAMLVEITCEPWKML